MNQENLCTECDLGAQYIILCFSLGICISALVVAVLCAKDAKNSDTKEEAKPGLYLVTLIASIIAAASAFLFLSTL